MSLFASTPSLFGGSSLFEPSIFSEFGRMRREMDRLLNTFDQDMPLSHPRLESGSNQPEQQQQQQQLANTQGGSTALQQQPQQQQRAWFWPAVDVKESDTAITVHAELPGLRKEDVNVSIEDGILTVSGERKQESRQENERFHRVERSYGSFKRSFRLPEGAHEDEITATCQDGVLTVTVPRDKPAEKKPKKIAIA